MPGITVAWIPAHGDHLGKKQEEEPATLRFAQSILNEQIAAIPTGIIPLKF